ncbi:hypothetical protein [Paenibacillus sp. L3-i20]|uniref:hypothetical protein n=1 Tax=Paenibacillus sp. L3-i20 TaxID=2905833 RepID=UPI0020808950|nr:hypothetical protein [Paenibacillus sp. L3-i20]GKU79318.1 hypothetical protein L3i20_v237150 [Paenibacillus sp. L3-i20]
MVKKKHSQGKGYKRRYLAAQYKESAKHPYLQEVEEGLQVAELESWKRKAEQYQAAWEKEKSINKTYSRDWKAILAHQANQRRLSALRGVLVGLFLGFSIMLLDWALS